MRAAENNCEDASLLVEEAWAQLTIFLADEHGCAHSPSPLASLPSKPPSSQDRCVGSCLVADAMVLEGPSCLSTEKADMSMRT